MLRGLLRELDVESLYHHHYIVSTSLAELSGKEDGAKRLHVDK